MQQRSRRLMFLVCGTLISSGLLFVAACSTDNGTTTPLPGQSGDSGRRDGSSSSSTSSSSSSGSSGDPADAGADCANAPKVFNNTGVFCFGGAGSTDGGICDPAENKVCCSDNKDDAGTFTKARCEVATQASSGGYQTGACGFTNNNGREWHCTQSDHCPGSAEVCCVIKGTAGSPRALEDTKDFPGCGQYFNSDQGANVGGSRCRAACEAGELQLCAKDDECEQGTTCHYFVLANRKTGVCK